MKIKDLFFIEYPKTLIFADQIPSKRGINFVSSSSSNNGIVGKVEFNPKAKKYPAGIITVPLKGSVLNAFVQPEDCYVAHQIAVLIPKQEMSDNEKLFYCLMIRKNKYRYSYGRQADRTLPDLEIPLLKDIPSWVRSLNVKELKKEPVYSKKEELNTKNWKNFKIVDIFDIKKGERLVKEERVAGDIPLITATSENNGVVEFISYDEFKDNKKIFQDKLTIDMFFNVFYHDYKYFSDDNVHTLIPKNFSLNKYVCLFLVTVLKKLQYKYDFGRQVRLQRLDFDEIKLPVDKHGTPDWKFMENYVKSLAYSSNL